MDTTYCIFSLKYKRLTTEYTALYVTHQLVWKWLQKHDSTVAQSSMFQLVLAIYWTVCKAQCNRAHTSSQLFPMEPSWGRCYISEEHTTCTLPSIREKPSHNLVFPCLPPKDDFYRDNMRPQVCVRAMFWLPHGASVLTFWKQVSLSNPCYCCPLKYLQRSIVKEAAQRALWNKTLCLYASWAFRALSYSWTLGRYGQQVCCCHHTSQRTT